MFVNDFSGVDHAIEGARDNLDLTVTRCDHAEVRKQRNASNVPRRKSRVREYRYDSDLFLKTLTYRPRSFSLEKRIRWVVAPSTDCVGSKYLSFRLHFDREARDR